VTFLENNYGLPSSVGDLIPGHVYYCPLADQIFISRKESPKWRTLLTPLEVNMDVIDYEISARDASNVIDLGEL